jgi:hypothetical protein
MVWNHENRRIPPRETHVPTRTCNENFFDARAWKGAKGESDENAWRG